MATSKGKVRFLRRTYETKELLRKLFRADGSIDVFALCTRMGTHKKVSRPFRATLQDWHPKIPSYESFKAANKIAMEIMDGIITKQRQEIVSKESLRLH